MGYPLILKATVSRIRKTSRFVIRRADFEKLYLKTDLSQPVALLTDRRLKGKSDGLLFPSACLIALPMWQVSPSNDLESTAEISLGWASETVGPKGGPEEAFR